MQNKNFLFFVLAAALFACNGDPKLANDQLHISWSENSEGWKIDKLAIMENAQWKSVSIPSGEYTLLYSANKPDSVSFPFKTVTGISFPEPIYKYQIGHWLRSTSPVALNTAGEAFHFYPAEQSSGKGEVTFKHELPVGTLSSSWKLDPRYPADIIVSQTLVVKKDGYYSLATPTLTDIKNEEISWATVPGYFQGNAFQENFVLAYAYGQGIPTLPVIYTERCASTLAPIITTKDNVSISVSPKPGLARDPWEKDKITHEDSRIGLSHMNRRGNIAPTIYYPVLGKISSKIKAGDTIEYEFRYTVNAGGWFENLKHVANDIYQLKNTLDLRTNKQSLMSRIESMHHYLTDPKTSMWNIETFQGKKIGGQSYLGGVIGSNGDAMKNSDYGAMWMLASATQDDQLRKNVLPYAANFKLTQQQTDNGFFKGAAVGQYYLAKRKVFVEEWGEFVEPVSLTYYTMLDVGNILLFEPQNKELRERLKLGADLLLKWQQSDGRWEVAYDRHTEKPLFTDIKDLRPTFYGLIVAHRILKDQAYLDAAKKGADWLIENSIKTGHFIGVCGDARYVPDFATAQTSQAYLDIYDITKEKKYKEAAIEAGRFYTASVYTHPVPSQQKKLVKDVVREDWEIAQAGLSFEHGGIMGSAQRTGPIQLASHAGLFVRLFGLTQDSLFLTMARSAAIGRDAFVDTKTSVTSYYWNAMNKGAGPYPHHAWWQIGWITDYLMSEAELRSQGKVKFSRGFVTPKVGPHQSYGFEPGQINGAPASLVIRHGLVQLDNPNLEHITALSQDSKKLYVIIMNDIKKVQKGKLQMNSYTLHAGSKLRMGKELMSGNSVTGVDNLSVELPAYGIQVYAFDME